MKRGKPNSGAVHKPVKDYYAELDKREKELTEGLEKYKARGELRPRPRHTWPRPKQNG